MDHPPRTHRSSSSSGHRKSSQYKKINSSSGEDTSLTERTPKKKINRSAKKLTEKGLSLKVDPSNAGVAKRYYHICVDKLADAFEKQFMMGLPDFGLYTQNDQIMSPKSIRAKLD